MLPLQPNDHTASDFTREAYIQSKLSPSKNCHWIRILIQHFKTSTLPHACACFLRYGHPRIFGFHLVLALCKYVNIAATVVDSCLKITKICFIYVDTPPTLKGYTFYKTNT